MRHITESLFVACTGRKPVDDDMERVNCPKQGEAGHFHCGWNWVLSAPCFEVGRPEIEKPHRNATCMDCGHTWVQPVEWSAFTQRLSGEKQVYCPKCRSRGVMQSAMFMRLEE